MRNTTITVTGADGFVGQNLLVRLAEQGCKVIPVVRGTSSAAMRAAIAEAAIVFHLAGANRPARQEEFDEVNRDFTGDVADAVRTAGTSPIVVFASSTKAVEHTPYGLSKIAGEAALMELAEAGHATVLIYRLPNVFGKWARPNYNSAVATFCHNIARGLPIRIDNAAATLDLIYVDDVIDSWLTLLETRATTSGYHEAGPVYATTVGAVADAIQGFAEDRAVGVIDTVGTGLIRALYATYVAALPIENFSFPLVQHEDARGSFSEMLKTRTSGQFSYFTAHPGVTRGGHYHHTKSEQFLIVHGEALFKFRHIVTGETHEVRTSGERPVVVQTIPGWSHDVTNVGSDVLVSMLWANEVFDRDRPDTIAATV